MIRKIHLISENRCELCGADIGFIESIEGITARTMKEFKITVHNMKINEFYSCTPMILKGTNKL